MTKKDYELIAGVINIRIDNSASSDEYTGVADTALYLADEFEKDNPRFNRNKFLQACGVERQTTEEYADERGLVLNKETNTYYDESGNEHRDENGSAVFGS